MSQLEPTFSATKNIAQKFSALQPIICDGLRDYTEKQCVKERYPSSTANSQIVQHCAAISAIAKLLSKVFCIKIC